MTTLIYHINYDELQEWQEAGKDFQLIDVRQADEHEAFNIGGDLIPLGKLLQETEKLETSKPIVFYCKRGIRSQLAIQRLADKMPYAHFYNLRNGILHLMPAKKKAV